MVYKQSHIYYGSAVIGDVIACRSVAFGVNVVPIYLVTHHIMPRLKIVGKSEFGCIKSVEALQMLPITAVWLPVASGCTEAHQLVVGCQPTTIERLFPIEITILVLVHIHKGLHPTATVVDTRGYLCTS